MWEHKDDGRSPAPSVPALSELDYPNFNMAERYGVFAPAGIPAATADRINAEVNKVLQRADVKAAIPAQGQEPKSDSRASFAAMVKSDSLRSRHDCQGGHQARVREG